ncbi:MAG: hypothetical protein Q4E17_00775 [Synergistes sp.]|nr:hypothetical protein [Synergistes sp.]
MTDEQRRKCHGIIHTAAAADAGGNIVPLPGSGIIADTATITTMAVALASVFGRDMSEGVAKGLASELVREVILKNPVKYTAKEVLKLIPGVGQLFAPTASAAIVELVGWNLANRFDAEARLERLSGANGAGD